MLPTDAITLHFRLQALQLRALRKLGIETLAELLRHLPSRYEYIGDVKRVADLAPGEQAIVYGVLSKLATRKALRRRTPIAEGVLSDGSGSLKVIWFNQPYLAKMVPEGSRVKVSGKVGGTAEKRYLANPEGEPAGEAPGPLFGGAQTLIPVYPESRGITSKWFQHAVQKILKGGALAAFLDPLPAELLARYHLPSLETALIFAHAPRRLEDAAAARKRFAFEEVFLIQLGKQQVRRLLDTLPAVAIVPNREGLAEFIGKFPFTPTAAQRRATETILADFAKPRAMAPPVEAAVGSGKTAVAAATAYTVSVSTPKGQGFGNLQVA